ncbi:MAG: hypothetical protein ABSD63_12305, partial [Candidatus Korobacteraceae bacterium]
AKCAEFPLSHSDHDGYMSKPKNQNRTFHLLQKADILTCYEHKKNMAPSCLQQRAVVRSGPSFGPGEDFH